MLPHTIGDIRSVIEWTKICLSYPLTNLSFYFISTEIYSTTINWRSSAYSYHLFPITSSSKPKPVLALHKPRTCAGSQARGTTHYPFLVQSVSHAISEPPLGLSTSTVLSSLFILLLFSLTWGHYHFVLSPLFQRVTNNFYTRTPTPLVPCAVIALLTTDVLLKLSSVVSGVKWRSPRCIDRLTLHVLCRYYMLLV